MKTTLNRKSLRTIILCGLFIVIFGASLFVTFCFWSAIFPSNTQAVATAFVLISLLFALVATNRLTLVLLLVLSFAYFTLTVFWGAIIPYIQLLPFIISYLFLVEEKDSLIAPFFVVVIVLTATELLGIIPLFHNDVAEVGVVNLLIIGVLQVVSYTIWTFILRFYAVIQRLDLLGFEELSTNTSRNFLTSTLAKGLYISILLHFFNNYLNRITWGVPTKKSSRQLLKLLAESERVSRQRVYSVSDIMSFCELPINHTNNKSKQLTVANAKTLFLLLFNIAHNYRKNGNSFDYIFQQISPDIFQFTFTADCSTQSKNIWSRNLGNMKQFLKLTNTGELAVSHSNQFFTTELLYTVH